MKMGLPEQLMLKRLQNLDVLATKYVKEVGPLSKRFMLYTIKHKADIVDMEPLKNRYPSLSELELKAIVQVEKLKINLDGFIGDRLKPNDDLEDFAVFMLLLMNEAANDVYLFYDLTHQKYTETGK